jgi:hypothetical protein
MPLRAVGLLWFVYIAIAGVGEATHLVPAKLAGTAFYFVIALAVYRLFAPAEPWAALALIPLAALGCIIQGVGQARADRDLQLVALVFFGLFLATVGYLVLRTALLPQWVGVALVLAGLAWCASMVPGTPLAARAIVAALGAIAEGAFALSLILSG